jgi:hypothetical protein
MTGTRRPKTTLRSGGSSMGAAAGRQQRALIPMTPRVIFRALLGVLLFFCGIVFGAWLIIRFRRHFHDSRP